MSGSSFKWSYANETLTAAHTTPQPTKDSISLSRKKNALLVFFEIDVLNFSTSLH